MHVLLIEDETETLEALASYLRLHNLVVYEATTLKEASRLLQSNPVEIMVLDIELPDGCGLEWLQHNASACQRLGLIIVSAHHQEATRLKGLALGADVFLRKPLAARELYLQLENLAARLPEARPYPERDSARSRGWHLDLPQWQLISPVGDQIPLTLSEIRLLQTMARWCGQPVSRQTIILGLQADPASYDERRLETLVRRLRQKVRTETGALSLPLITVRGVGYAFKSDLQVSSDA
ncbi:response regulator transcription factor [Hydrogenovibrio halophilus]|uniref:response regulator transcription factor n=1 Tax=Hydrogenovibrio halophilus TaxID=373391 RepID=UPI0003777FA7|nr:response regulator transcription factor [Hydrogenovibrio halophilus]